MPICWRVFSFGRGPRTIPGKRYRGKQIPDERGKKVFLSREPFPGGRFSLEETFIVPTKLLYLSIGKTKASYFVSIPVFSSVTSHSVSFSLFFPSFLPSSPFLFLSTRPPPKSSRFCAQHEARYSRFSPSLSLIRLGRVELLYTEAGVVYFVSTLDHRLPRDNSLEGKGRESIIVFSSARMKLIT